MLDAEGGTRTWFFKLMRHEVGHAYSYAYRLYKKKKWQKIFGLASKEYPETYNPRPYSRSYVIHLNNWYAQSHPDEDFAETVAVWLTPGINWRKRYRGWKAMEKLLYVDHLMKSLRGKAPAHQPRFRARDHDGLRIQLRNYYARKKKAFAESYPDFYDSDLKQIFTVEPQERSDVKAHRYLKTNRRALLNAVAEWTREKKYTIHELLQKLIARSAELNLYTRKDSFNTETALTAYVTTLVMNHLFTGRFKKTKHT